jgi:aconitate hydratase
VGKIVEFYGPGLGKLSLPDRATIGNMSPEYGATAAFFPVDDETLNYLLGTGRKEENVDLVKRYAIEQGLFHTGNAPEPLFSEKVELDMGTVEPSLAGPKRPQDRIPLGEMRNTFRKDMEKTFVRTKGPEVEMHHDYSRWLGEGGNFRTQHMPLENSRANVFTKYKGEAITDGSVVIAAITSCTNTSNPSVMIGAGILAKKAVEHGLKVKPYVKTSLAPGSRVVTDYYKSSGLLPYLEALGFHLVGYGCTTCIGNSGPVSENIAQIVKENDLVVAAVLSGNRNFEGRINQVIREIVNSKMFEKEYSEIFKGTKL